MENSNKRLFNKKNLYKTYDVYASASCVCACTCTNKELFSSNQEGPSESSHYGSNPLQANIRVCPGTVW